MVLPGPIGPRSRTGTPGPRTLPAADSTTVIPAYRDGGIDSTTVMPAYPGGGVDSTTILPALSDVERDRTAVIPAIRDGQPPHRYTGRPAHLAETSVLPAILGPSPRTGGWTGWRTLLRLAPLVASILLWLLGLANSSTTTVGDYGLLSMMSPAFFAALGLCILGFLLELLGPPAEPGGLARSRSWLLIGYAAQLVLIMHATVPLLVREPEYAWTYRHVGVIEYIRSLGSVTNSLDVYQQWPTFFALVAQLIAVSGGHTLTVAAWAPVFFDALDCVPLFAIARTLSADARVPYLTIFGFTALNWVAQDYLSPQAFAFLLCLGLLLVMLRWLRQMPQPLTRVRIGWLDRLQSWLQVGLVEVPYTSKHARRLALFVLYTVYAVVVAAHQLSPYLVAASAIALVVLGLIKPVRIVPILLGIAVSYVVPRYHVVDNYGIFSGLDFLRNASGVGPTTGTVTAARSFSVEVVRTFALAIWALTALCELTARRRLGPVALPATLAFTPFVLLGVQNYGGEAVYRVFLFSSPWCAYLLARQVLLPARSDRLDRRRRGYRLLIGVPVGCAMVLATMQGEHGQLSFDQFTVGEVRSAEYLYAHVPDGADIVYARENYPARLSARYGALSAGRIEELDMLDDAGNGPVPLDHPLTQEDLGAVIGYFDALDSPYRYLVISRSMSEQAHYFGYLPDGLLERLDGLIASSPSWRLWYHADGVDIFQFVVPPA
jgi:hypothetical protein